MDNIYDLLFRIAENQNTLIDLLKKHDLNTEESHEDIDIKLSETLSTSIAMMHLTENNINELKDIIVKLYEILKNFIKE